MMAITTSSSMSVNACPDPAFPCPDDDCHVLPGSMGGLHQKPGMRLEVRSANQSMSGLLREYLFNRSWLS